MAAVDDAPLSKKLRRSTRLEVKVKEDWEESRFNDNKSGPLGYFQRVPLEIQFHILSNLGLDDLSVLTITSKQLRNVVELYRTTPWTQRFLLPRRLLHSQIYSVEEQAGFFSQFKKLGLLMKRATCLYATRDRLKFVLQCLHKFLCTPQSCPQPSACLALTCFGRLLQTVIAGWDDKECIKVLDTVCTSTLMFKHLTNIVQSKPGSHEEEELHARLFLRRVFLNHTTAGSDNDKAFWLQHILKSFPMVHQARILFLLYGPFIEGAVQWHEMCESTPVTKEQARVCFGDLANAFRVLHNHGDRWSEDDIISVLEELTSFPDEWLAENVANLLHLCGENIVLKVLHSKAINGRMSELASIITYISLVCIRHGQGVAWVMSLVGHVAGVFDYHKQRVAFAHAIIDMYKDILMDIHEYDDDTPLYFQQMLEAMVEFTKFLAVRAFKTDTLLHSKQVKNQPHNGVKGLPCLCEE